MADESENSAQNAALHQIVVPLNGNYREELSFGRQEGTCLYHFTASIRRANVRIDFDLPPRSTTAGSPSTTSGTPSTTSGSPLTSSGQPMIIPAERTDGGNRQLRRGAPFCCHTDYNYLGRAGRRGPRMYSVDILDDTRIYLANRTVQGSRPSQKIVLLRCERFYTADCEAFGYKYEGALFLYGFHNHE